MNQNFENSSSDGNKKPFDPFAKEDKSFEHKTKEPRASDSAWMWKLATGVLGILLIVSIFTHGFNFTPTGGAVDVVDTDEDGTGNTRDEAAVAAATETDLTFTILNDPECEDCDTTRVTQVTEELFPGIKVVEVDFSTEDGKELYDKYNVQYLPAYFFTSNVDKETAYEQVSGALVKLDDAYMINPQASGSTYDPYGEKCANGIDDNDDGLVDCDDPDCSEELACMEKKEVPEVEAFVMSHCPYGTQIEKGLIPVIEELGDSIDFKLRFVHYAMHGDKEVYEELNQYCIQKEQEDKLLPYLNCFLADGDGETCLEEVEIDMDMLESCVEDADEEFSITSSFEDKSTWMGNFPPFDVNKDLAEKYGVQGSPTLVLNGMVVSSSRDPASLLKTICYGFEEQPDACDAELSTDNPAPGFGFEGTAAAADGSCN
ncbi:hypothetical protein KY330_05015 [Candidatus Woesearchaeota archaeon]|nr:hypothetical protein [Candidatus Woesearchaeota archaeon]